MTETKQERFDISEHQRLTAHLHLGEVDNEGWVLRSLDVYSSDLSSVYATYAKVPATRYVVQLEPGEFGEGATVAVARQFPIKHDDQLTSIPWDVIMPHEMQALANHRSTLDRLAARGGLTPEEALAVIEGRPWERTAFTDARRRLLDYVRGATDDEETVARLDAACAPDTLNLEDLRACIRMVEDFREGVQHPSRWNCNRLITTLDRVRGRIEKTSR